VKDKEIHIQHPTLNFQRRMAETIAAGRGRHGAVLTLVLFLSGCTAVQSPAPPDFLSQHGLSYWLVVQQTPRPLRIHHLRVDLANPRIELLAAPANDPDGDGPATAALTPPRLLAERSRAIALVNANPWQGLPNAAGRRDSNWREQQPVQILGLVAAQGTVRSTPADGHCAFWIDRAGRPGMGVPSNLAEVREGVAGFAQLVRDGEIVVPPGGPIHPRTALGLDASRRYLYLVVVDGRQPGYSEGLANGELADYLLRLGCRDAMNLDGGGSSILLLADDGSTLRTVNDPSTKKDGRSIARPIPIALVVRLNSQ
jgi:hypothetical protein